ncbi:ABC transporter permease subunit [Acidicapsa ligni]|uniref:ABC transporter permease subunit n=1 Tax=Acidicapsa ligni TaxID=542300 RepID=UPI0021E08A49|nr:ABC transporter permease subunit [Acidicapsa ligni]
MIDLGLGSNVGSLMDVLLPAAWETLCMVAVSAPLCALSGLAIGALLVATSRDGISPTPSVYQGLAAITNLTRSIPFLILIVLLLPLTRLLVGSSIGTVAAMVPLVFGGTPYAARLAEAALLEVDPGLVQAAITMGATPWQAMWKVYIPEAVPGLIRAGTVLGITMINFSAMAGAVGGGGLGDLAIRYGYQRFRMDVLLAAVVVLLALVQGMQWAGNTAARQLDRR